jgi:hypothetical protein
MSVNAGNQLEDLWDFMHQDLPMKEIRIVRAIRAIDSLCSSYICLSRQGGCNRGAFLLKEDDGRVIDEGRVGSLHHVCKPFSDPHFLRNAPRKQKMVMLTFRELLPRAQQVRELLEHSSPSDSSPFAPSSPLHWPLKSSSRKRCLYKRPCKVHVSKKGL